VKFEGKHILLISPEPWDHIFVSKHHYAIHLSKRGNLVYFLGPPTNRYALDRTDFENVFTVAYPGFPRGLRYYPAFLQRYFIRKRFDQIQKLCKIEFDIIWSFDNSVFFDFSSLPNNVLKISHIVDLNQDFQTEKAARTADYCLCTTELIKERLLKYNPKVFKINHGFNGQNVESAPISLPGTSKVKALYAGNLAIPFIDWVLLHQVVMENPQVDFIFAGPNADLFNQNAEQNLAKKSIQSYANTFFVGRLKSEELIRYQVSADVLLVAYQEAYHSNQAANPHKMMEYLGSGKMIVATHTSEFEQFANEGVFLMSNKNFDYPALFNKANTKLKHWNNRELSERRKDIALDNTYEKQIERIESILNTISQ
jgi:glycosyltransferase involved in cell wall biosynthesis